MKQTLNAPMVPTAGIAVNKSRLKVYSTGLEMPTYYLQKGQEFQIEIFNPTRSVVLAKISLNNTLISQGGLILNPGQRVFLERYIDVPKKFLFDTYEVANTDEVKKAIESNGDIKIEFFREYVPINYNPIITLGNYDLNQNYLNNTTIGTDPQYLRSTTTAGLNLSASNSTKSINNNDVKSHYSDSGSAGASYDVNLTNSNYTASLSQLDFLNTELSRNLGDEAPVKKQMRGRKLSKSIETGRVEKGSHSSQAFKTVNKLFELWAFHTIEYKLLPISQKINTLEDINVKVYCTNCGAKLGKTDRFCSSCGTKK
jgi:hypothetical protein